MDLDRGIIKLPQGSRHRLSSDLGAPTGAGMD